MVPFAHGRLQQALQFLPGQFLLEESDGVPLLPEPVHAQVLPPDESKVGVQRRQHGIGAGESHGLAQLCLVGQHGLAVRGGTGHCSYSGRLFPGRPCRILLSVLLKLLLKRFESPQVAHVALDGRRCALPLIEPGAERLCGGCLVHDTLLAAVQGPSRTAAGTGR